MILEIERLKKRMEEQFARYNLPPYMWDGLDRYMTHGILPGSFLTAVLSNDLKEAVARADENNQRSLVNWVGFLYNTAPTACWGSPERFENWTKQRGWEAYQLPAIGEASPVVSEGAAK